MKFVVRPELPTAALRSSQATLAAVDNSAPLATRRSPLKTRGNVVQTTGATSIACDILLHWHKAKCADQISFSLT